MTDTKNALRPEPDELLRSIADYVCSPFEPTDEALSTARYCLLDSLGCAMLALDYPACTKLLGPIVPGAEMQDGISVPGTSYQLDPVQAAFNIGAMVRWLDYNDTWLAAEWGHPSDNLGAILSAVQLVEKQSSKETTIKDILTAMIQAYEIQGILALNNSFNKVGLDHVLLVRIASTAVAASILGASEAQVINALSNAWVDGGALRTYRHAPNTGSRKSWAAGDATARGLWHVIMALKQEMGYPSALSAKHWGFQDILYEKNKISVPQAFDNYVMENILFKVSFPAEFHAQTAVEAALQLHDQVKDRLEDIDEIFIESQKAAIRIIDKTGPLDNPADRDHCLQYMIAVPLIFGRLKASDYEDHVASEPRIDQLRAKMKVRENKQFSKDYLNPDKRAIGNAITIKFKDGSTSETVRVDYPIGHKRRRNEAIPQIIEKFESNAKLLGNTDIKMLTELFNDMDNLLSYPTKKLIDLFYMAN